MYLFGGSKRGDLEVYNTKSNTTRTIDIKLNEQFSPEIFEGLSHSENSIIVQYYKLKEKDVKVSEEDELVLTFGTTE